MSIQEQRRKAFEAAYPFSDLYVFVCERYICGQVRPSTADREGVDRINEAWFYWNAALDSVEIKLPDDGRADCEAAWGERCKDDFDTGYNFASLQHEKAIEAAGLRVKP